MFGLVSVNFFTHIELSGSEHSTCVMVIICMANYEYVTGLEYERTLSESC